MFSPMFNLAFFPILSSLWFYFMLICCYLLGILRGHFDVLWPTVSDTGNYIPEAAIFTLVLGLVCISALITFFIRYLQIRAILNDNAFRAILTKYYNVNQNDEDHAISRTNWHRLNFWNILLGLLTSSFGMGVGAFRFHESIIWHNLSAVGIFMTMPAYLVIDAFYFTPLFTGYLTKPATTIRRRTIVIISLASLVVFLPTQLVISHISPYHAIYVNPVKRLFWWRGNYPGLVLHLINAVIEWIYLVTVPTYLFTLAEDFSRIIFVEVKLAVVFYEEKSAADNPPQPASPGGGSSENVSELKGPEGPSPSQSLLPKPSFVANTTAVVVQRD